MLNAVLALNELDTHVFDSPSLGAAPRVYDDFITVPDAHLLFHGEFKRVGTNDLKIVGEDGASFFIPDYFASEKRPHLMSPQGATLGPDVVAALAGPLAPGQQAQAGAQPAAGQPVIGRVDAVTGSATVVRNGVTVALNVGDNVQRGDVVQTSGSSSVAIVLADGSTFSLNANARMVLDNLVYNASGTGNSALVSLVQGTFSFVAGQVAKTGEMRVETPVATMGIRGTAVLVEISASDGQTRFSVMVEPDGTTGSFNLYNKSTGALIATVNNSQVGWVLSPAGPLQVIAQQEQKTPAQLQQELGIVQQIFTIFNNNQQNPFVPPQENQERRGDNPNDTNPQTAQAGGGSGQPLTIEVPISTPEQPVPTTVSVTITPIAPATDDAPPPPDPAPLESAPPGPTPPPVPTLNVINGSGEIFGTAGNDKIFGSETPDTIDAGAGNDFVHAGGDDDVIIAGLGEGNDFYDGGTDTHGDTIKFGSVTDGVVFNLNNGTFNLADVGIVKSSTAQSSTTGLDVFVRVEKIVASPGNDIFILHDLDDWVIDAGDGIDIVRFANGIDIPAGAGGPEISNYEIVDLATDLAQNIVHFDIGDLDDVGSTPLRILGGATDRINLTNTEAAPGTFEKIGDNVLADTVFDDILTDGVLFDVYQVTVGEDQHLVYVQDGIQITPPIEARDDQATMGENQTLTLDLLANDSSGLGTASVTSLGDETITGPQGITLGSPTVAIVDGKLQIVPGTAFDALGAGQSATISVDYTIQNTAGETSSATATVVVTGANDAPSVAGPVAGAAIEDGATVTLNALANASDADAGAALSVVNVPSGLPAGVTFNSVTQSFTLDPGHAAYQGLDAGEQITVQVSYGVSDGTATTPASVSWTVTGTNDAPEVTDAVTGAATEDGDAVTLNALANASDADGDTLSVVNVPSELPAGVTFDSVTQTFTLDPGDPAYQALKAGEQITVDVVYGVSDGEATTPASASWTVTGTNDGPVANDDVLSGGLSGTSLNIALVTPYSSEAATAAAGLGALDSFASITQLTDLSSISATDLASFDAILTWSDIQYPDPISIGNAFADYVDGGGGLVIATYALSDPWWLQGRIATDGYSPLEPTSSLSTPSGQIVAIADDPIFEGVDLPGLANTFFTNNNFANAPLDQGAFLLATDGAGRNMIARNADGNIIAANIFPGFEGSTETDFWQLFANMMSSVADGDGAFSSTESSTIAVSRLLGNDTDADGDTLTIVSVSGLSAMGATVTLNTDGTITYDPAGIFELVSGETATDSFTYTVADPSGASDTATVSFQVTGTNHVPVITAPVTGTATEDGAEVTLDALANASDADGDTLSVVNVPPNLPAGVSFDSVTQSFSLDPGHAAYQALGAGEEITVEVDYGVSDGQVTTPASVSWTVTGTNDAPEVTDAVTGAATEDGNAVTLNALANASDADGDTLSVVNVPSELPAGVTFDSVSQTFTLDPDAYQSLAAGEEITVEVDYGVSDGTVTTAATVSWMVTGTNDAPQVTGTVTDAAVEDGAEVTLDALANASDADGDTLSVVNVPVNLPAGVSFDSVTQSFSLDPGDAAYQALGAGEEITVEVDYGVSDGQVTTPASVSWTVTGTNDAPVAQDDTLETIEDGGPVVFDVTANDGDVEGDALEAVNVSELSDPSLGTLVYDGDGQFTFTPAENASGTATFTYQASDGDLPSDTATVTINVAPVADAPVVTTTYEAPDGQPVGGEEFSVNVNAVSLQFQPQVTQLADGRLLFTWASFGDDIAARIGTPQPDGAIALGDEFSVNSQFTNLLLSPQVAQLADGRLLFTWASNDGSIAARIGTLDTGDSIAFSNELTVGSGGSQQVTQLADGRLLFTWNSWDTTVDGDAAGIAARIGTLQPEGTIVFGDEFAVNARGSSNQLSPQVTQLADGTLLFTWMSYDPAVDGDSAGIAARIATLQPGDGVALGNEFTVNAHGVSDQGTPQVKELADGRLLFVWHSWDPAVDGDSTGIAARIGTPQPDGSVTFDNEFTVNAGAVSFQQLVQVTTLADGRLLFTWESVDPAVDGDSTGIAARIGTLQPDGSIALADEFTINARVASDQQRPQVTQLADGQLLFVWSSHDPAVDGDSEGIAARIFTLPLAGETEDTPATLPLTAALPDNDGSEVLQRVVITGLPDEVSLAIGARQDDGSWLIDRLQGETFAALLDDLADGGTLTLIPAENFNGSFTLSVTATSRETGNGDEATSAPLDIPVTIVPVNDAPVAQDDTLESIEDGGPVVFDVTANDGDVEGDALEAVNVSELSDPSLGTLVYDEDTHLFTFTPAENASGTATFTYQASDGDLQSETATVTINVAPVNDAPVIVAAIDTGSVSPGNPLSDVAAGYLAANHNLVNGLGGNAGFGEFVLAANDDGSTGPIDITAVFGQQGLNFFGTNYTSFFINNNGNITFGGSLSSYTPSQIAGNNLKIIAPFWADVETLGQPLVPTPGGNSTGSNLVHYDLDAENGVVTITWDDVGHFSDAVDKLNAFQLQLIDRGDGNFDIVFRYEDVNWTTGDASGGINGLGGTPARAGYTAGDGNPSHYFELSGSGTQDGMLALEQSVGNTGIAGVHVFEVRAGDVGTPTSSGTIAFADPDAGDTHTVSAAYNAADSDLVTPLGTLNTTLAQDTSGGRNGLVSWQYVIDPALLNALAPGTVLTEVFDVTIDDGQGGTVTQQVAVTVNGPEANTVMLTVETDQGLDTTSIFGQLLVADLSAADESQITLVHTGSEETLADDLLFVIDGRNFAFDTQQGESRLVGGTITGMTLLRIGDGPQVPLATFTGFAIDGVEIQQAIEHFDETGDTGDFEAIFQSYAYTATGGAGADLLAGGNRNDILIGGPDNDILIGAGGNDRAVYRNATDGITVELAQGVVNGPGIGTDTLLSVENITGSRFADTYDAAGFGPSGPNAGSLGFTNSFEGLAGDDTVTGNGATILTFVRATAGVEVDIAAGTASGNASVGNDTFTGVSGLRGSQFDDTLLGSNTTSTVEVFLGEGGDDLMDGRGGFDRAIYASILNDMVTGSIDVHMASGVVTGDASVGTDTLRSIEAVRGSRFDDTYDATGFGVEGALNAGSNGTFNEFEGSGGNDSITGNGNTRIAYYTATGGVTVDLAAGTASGNASVGDDTFTGVNAVTGSQHDDTMFGSDNPQGTGQSFEGRAGDDSFDGRGGFDIAVYGNDATVSAGIVVDMAAGIVTGPAEIGTDTLQAIEAIRGTQFDDVYVATGFDGSSDNAGSLGTFNEFEGLGGNDTITGNGNTRLSYISATGPVTVDLKLGSATGNASVGTDSFTGVSAVRGSHAADTLIGNGFNNSLDGQGGDDTLTGGDGEDFLTGGGGNDNFVFSPGSGQDIIFDMTLGNPLDDPDADVIVLDGYGFGDVSDLTIEDNGQGFVRIMLGEDQWIDLNGIAHGTVLSNQNFNFGTVLLA